MSETAASRALLAPYCEGVGLDMGFGGDPITKSAIAFDMPRKYTSVGSSTQHLQGDARYLPFVCDESMDFIYSSHLIEDFPYPEQIQLISEWRRCLKVGGLLVTNCPDQQKFLEHCQAHFERTGEDVRNLAHKEDDFSLETFTERVLRLTGPWESVMCEPSFGVYSWLLVVRKVGE